MSFYVKRGFPGIHLLASRGRVSALKNVLQNGEGDVDELSNCGFTPLMLSVFCKQLECVKVLLSFGANPNFLMPYIRNSPLHIAAEKGASLICLELLMKKSNVDSINAYGNTPLIISCMNGHVGMVRSLLEFGADPNKKNFVGASPIFMAIDRGNLRIMQLLLKGGANPSLKSVNDWSPLYLAAWKNNPKACRLLLKYGHPVDLGQDDGTTPLAHAVKQGYVSVVRELLNFNPSLIIEPIGSNEINLVELTTNDEVNSLLMNRTVRRETEFKLEDKLLDNEPWLYYFSNKKRT